ncbi:TetR/AcrR family transcriptional regulator [Magnetospira sp. QH-2]|uniref:TetR/AcrR family transcriptional regulator n=1 Tax=Magnetospira sp. (strain QH-2) TaxID=1288970 RepID=UPI0003E81229|nr:TetR/AcrR family transcriptional regulator [Magnetospira sp. QH-2]CCQ72249.1 Putative Transcriptional regulator, TetR family protein [Magnetospira sp. QH-2]
MARPREFDQNEVMNKVVEVFWSRGFEATSIQDLEGATGLKRGSLYNAFGDKATLFQEALSHYLEQSVVRRHLQTATTASARTIIDGLLDVVVQEGAASRKGCLITNTVTELAGRDAAVAETVTEALNGLNAPLIELLRRAQTEEDLAPDADVAALARYIVGTIQGLRVMSKVSDDRQSLQVIADSAKNALWCRTGDGKAASKGGFFDSLFGKGN